MSGFFKVQLAGFALAVLLVASLIGWTARVGWKNVAELRERYKKVDIESYQFAEHVRAVVLSLNEALVWFEAKESAPVRAAFNAQSVLLVEEISRQLTQPQSALEKSNLVQLANAVAQYRTTAEKLLEESAQQPGADLARRLVEVKDASAPLFDLCRQLAEAHQIALNRMVANSQAKLAQLQLLMLAAAVLLLLFVGALAALVYRAMIAPLRTQLVASQAIIERQEKLSSLGLLAAGVAHEIRNPLTAIKVRLHSLKRVVQKDPSAHEDVTFMDDEIGRLERIVNEFLQFARPPNPRFVRIPAADLLREVHQFMQPELAGRPLQFALGPLAPGWVRADPQQIKQVLINLVKNAAESLIAGGSITLRARAAQVPLAGRATPVMVLEVSDTGPGIRPEVQKRLFDPFFTTKDGGTGLGLAIAARILQNHAGTVQYQTQLQRGTTFGVVLPRIADDETENPPDRR